MICIKANFSDLTLTLVSHMVSNPAVSGYWVGGFMCHFVYCFRWVCVDLNAMRKKSDLLLAVLSATAGL